MTEIELSDYDRALLSGSEGEAGRAAMNILVTMAGVYGAERLLDIELAHIDGCLLHGDSGLEFAEMLLAGGARVKVPTTLNVGAFDLMHPENFRGDDDKGRKARRLMECYQEMGCEPIFTCAPYQTKSRVPLPALGQQIAWAESNAIVFANSVLGARTQRYGDFIDICAAITGRALAVGLHLDQGRRADVVVDLTQLPRALVESEVFFPVLGYWLGETLQNRIPVLLGLPADTDQDRLKALGAAAASSGALALFHAVGVTPEAPTLEAILRRDGAVTPETLVVDVTMLTRALDVLSSIETISGETRIDVVALGSPHFSLEEFRRLVPLLEQSPPCDEVEFVVCTNRFVEWALREHGLAERLSAAGVRIVVDTCVVVTEILDTEAGALMTNSGKFAHYTPGNIGLDVVFGSVEECVRSAASGRLWRDPRLWTSHREGES
jgi:predicted aconitase